MENFAQSPDMMGRQKMFQAEDSNENFMYEPMKKIKTAANCPEFGLMNNQSNLLNQLQINEQIKNKGITSSYNPMFLAGSNHAFDPRFGANQVQVQVQESPQEINPSLLNSRALGFDLNELNAYQAPQSYLDQAKMMLQMQYNNAPMMRDQSGRPVQMSSNNLMRAQQNSLASQMSMLQNLEQQIAHSQKALEQLHAKTFMNAPNFNLANYQRERQFMMDQQQSQDFRALFEQGAHKVFGDFSFLKKNENPKADEVPAQNSSEFLDLNFDPNMFVEGFNYEENAAYEGLAFERPKLRPADDLDEKRTAATSACNPDEILFSQMAELLPEPALFGGSEANKKASPVKKDDSLLKKRKLDFVENEEKYIAEASSKNGDTKVKRGRPSLQNKTAPTPAVQPQAETEFSPSYDKPKAGSIKVKKDKSSPKIADYLPAAPVKRERRMNRLQSQRVAWENYFEEQKKPYTIKLHVEPTDEEYSKLVETRRGEAYQAEVQPMEPNAQTSERRRSIKKMWDPSLIESNKIQEFYARLTEIYTEEPRNEEAALMILRGTGMDVGSAIELIKNNCDYFRERLFTEPKPLKVQRAL